MKTQQQRIEELAKKLSEESLVEGGIYWSPKDCISFATIAIAHIDAEYAERENEFWEMLANLYDIESREECEAMAKNWNPSNPMVVALGHIWKREAKVTELEGKYAELVEAAKVYIPLHKELADNGECVCQQFKTLFKLEGE